MDISFVVVAAASTAAVVIFDSGTEFGFCCAFSQMLIVVVFPRGCLKLELCHLHN